MKKDKFLVSIVVPLQQHSYKTAEALINNNRLGSYYTTVYNDEKGIYKILKILY